MTQSVLLMKGPNSQKLSNKSREKEDEKKRKKCKHCGKMHGGECWKKMAEDTAAKTAAPATLNKKDKSKDSKEKSELTAWVASIISHDAHPIQLFMAKPSNDSTYPFEWIIDLGTSANMTCYCSWFMTFCPLVPPQPVIIGNGHSIFATGIG